MPTPDGHRSSESSKWRPNPPQGSVNPPIWWIRRCISPFRRAQIFLVFYFL